MRTRPEKANWRVTVASVIGPGHERAGLPNQDRYLVRPIGDRCCLYAVADGAGSRPRSDEGAELAVRAAEKAAEKAFGGTSFPKKIGDWRVAMQLFRQVCVQWFDLSVEKVTHEPGEHRDFATTLLAVVAAPPYVGFFSVGDCFLVVDRHPGAPALVVTAPEREHAGATTFLTSANRDDHLRTGVLLDDRVNALALCSDGVAEGLLGSRHDGKGHLHEFAPPEFRVYFETFGDPRTDGNELSAQLASPEFAATSSDDKTIVMAVRAR